MLAKRRILKVGEASAVRTPLLLPSFSSKGFPAVQKMVDTMEEYISDELLVSAYDIHHGLIVSNLNFASTIFLDSGGYEASKEHELSEVYEGEYHPRGWSLDQYVSVIQEWSAQPPTVFVSFDHPKHRASIPDQITRAMSLPLPNPRCARSFLIKPESEESKRVHIDKIYPHLLEMTEFSVIGVTEKEIGNSILSRMKNISLLRMALDSCNMETPIHIFGSLDTISTYLYFLCGADIFDGLTWLRYAFHDGDTIYRHSYGALVLPITTNSDVVEGRCWSNNYQYMQEMRLNMTKFLTDNDFSHFGKHSNFIKHAFQSVNAELSGG